jgi:ATP-dependent RNA helicase DeaD
MRRVGAARAVLDVLDPHRAVVWDPGPNAPARWADLPAVEAVRLAPEMGTAVTPADVGIAADLPSAEVFTALRQAARELVVLLDAQQLPYLQRLASPLDAVRLAGAADQARDRLTQLRRDVRERLAAGLPFPELLALDSLFSEHDPALVAAALLARGHAAAPAATPSDVTTWVRVHVNAGKRDQLRTGDVVGVLLNAVGLAKEDIGRIELREGFTLVDVRAEEAERAVRGLTGATLRGRRVAARLDRR